MLSKVYLVWGTLVCLGLVTADVLGWQTPSLFGPTASKFNSGPGGHSTGIGGPSYYGGGGSPSRGSGGSWGWGGGK